MMTIHRPHNGSGAPTPPTGEMSGIRRHVSTVQKLIVSCASVALTVGMLFGSIATMPAWADDTTLSTESSQSSVNEAVAEAEDPTLSGETSEGSEAGGSIIKEPSPSEPDPTTPGGGTEEGNSEGNSSNGETEDSVGETIDDEDVGVSVTEEPVAPEDTTEEETEGFATGDDYNWFQETIIER